MVVDQSGENYVIFETEFTNFSFELRRVDGVAAAGEHEREWERVLIFEIFKGFDQVDQIFVAAPNAGVKQIWRGDVVFILGCLEDFLIFNRMKLAIYSLVNDGDFGLR